MPSRGYRQQVEIQQRVTLADLWDDSADEWRTIAAVRAAIEPMQGREKLLAEQTTSQHTHKIRFRWAPSTSGLTTAERIKHGDRIYHLTSIVNVGARNREWECMATEQGQTVGS